MKTINWRRNFVAFFGISLLIAGCSSPGTPSTAAPPNTVTVTTTEATTVRTTAEVTVTATVTASAPVSGSTAVDVAPGGGPGGVIPAEFQEYSGGVYADFETNHDLFDCESGDGVCWGIKVIAVSGCPGGVAIKLTVYDIGTDVVRTTIDESRSEALPATELRTYVVGSSQLTTADVDAVEAEITNVACA